MISDEFALKNENTGELMINKFSLQKADEIRREYNGWMESFIWLPNSTVNRTMEPPTGIVTQVIPNKTPVFGDLFCDKMFQGTSAFKIPKGSKLFGGSMELTEENVIKNVDKIKIQLNKMILESANENGINLSHVEEGREVKLWSNELGNSGSYIGLYSSIDRNGYYPEKDYWIVVQSCSPSANEQISNLIEDAQPDYDLAPGDKAKITWEDFFINESNNELRYLQNAIKRNRARLGAQFVEIIGLQAKDSRLEIESDVESGHLTQKQGKSFIKKLTPTIETVTNYVSLYKGKPVYRSGAIDPSQITNADGGIIFNENPFVGPKILKGPENKSMLFGNVWHASNASLGSFPVWTGRSKTNREMRNQFKTTQSYISSSSKNILKTENKDLIDKFVWEKGNNNLRLIENVYFLRDQQFKKIENKLGYDHTYGEIQLKPLVVKIASTSN